MNDSEVAMYSVMIRNLPDEYSNLDLTNFVRNITSDYQEKLLS